MLNVTTAVCPYLSGIVASEIRVVTRCLVRPEVHQEVSSGLILQHQTLPEPRRNISEKYDSNVFLKRVLHTLLHTRCCYIPVVASTTHSFFLHTRSHTAHPREHTRTHTHTHARTHARTQHTHARTHAHTHTTRAAQTA